MCSVRKWDGRCSTTCTPDVGTMIGRTVRMLARRRQHTRAIIAALQDATANHPIERLTKMERVGGMSFEGEIGEIDLVQRLVDLGRERFTGAIRFENDAIIKIVYFKGGDILSASTNDRSDSIDEILFRSGKVTREHIKQALAKRKETETLGDALLGLGFITRKELTWARRVQVIGIIRSILGWQTGSWTIVADYLPKREEGMIFPLSQIILELIVTDPDRPKFERAMESGSAVFHRVDGFEDAFRRLGLNEDAEAITAHLDGVRSAADVASASGKDIFNVYKLLEALRVLGLLERADHVTSAEAMAIPAGIGSMSSGVDNPEFSLHDEPSSLRASSVDPAPSAMPSWKMEPEPDPAAAAAFPLARSAWDEPDEGLAPAQAAPTPEAGWGFDEAQIEAARRAALPSRSANTLAGKREVRTPSKPARSMGPIVAIVALLLLLAGGWAGWIWWQGRRPQSAVATATPVHRTPKPGMTAATATAFQPPGAVTASSSPGAPRPIASPIKTANTTSASNSPAGSMATTGTSAPMGKPRTQLAVSTTPAAVPVGTRNAQATVPANPKPVAGVVAAAPRAPAKKPAPMDSTRVERTSEGGATITNSGSAPGNHANDSDLQKKYEKMGRDFLAKPEGSFTVQIELVCETASVTRALASGGAKVWFVPITFHGRSCYRIFWGRFNTHEAAISASPSLPAGLKGSKPVVITVPRS